MFSFVKKLLVSIIVSTVCSWCMSAQATTNRILVAYFSATGNTAQFAKQIADIVNADLYEIVPHEKYSDDDLNYRDKNSRSSKENADANARPQIASPKVDLSKYDTVLIGYPIWWGEAPKIVYTFVEGYDFANKKLAAFCTSGSSPLGTSALNLKMATSKDAVWLESTRLSKRATAEDIKAWLESNKLIKVGENMTTNENTQVAQKKVIQTAGRDLLGSFAPEFAHFNDDVLFGENWNNTDISLKTRSIITAVSLIASGMTDSSLKYHLSNAKKHGVSKKEIAAIITHVAFYAGWPKAWAAFNLAKEVWSEESSSQDQMSEHQSKMLFPIGAPNVAYAKYFIGQSYLAPISTTQVPVYNVTFEPACRNNWHIHKATKGGGQILIGVAGLGIYQEEGKQAVLIQPGDVINIPANVKHWHGATKDSWFSHLAIEVPGENNSNEWLEPVDNESYLSLEMNK